jgi:diguanylate cyclase (GGDEF)-like protein
MSALFDLEIIEQLHESPRSLVSRARGADGAALIVKRPSAAFPSFQQLAQFKREYAIARRCRHPGVVRPLALQLHGGRLTMIQEDVGGVALDRVLRARLAAGVAPGRTVLDMDDFFDIALQLCAALEAVHGHGVIHKDVNPSNLVWNGERRLLQLIDFGIASELPQETQGIVHPRALEGTLRYMAPEQTGRMNRRIDYRADFYALGATFYELLTGQPPFDARDEMELVHCHIARTPDWSHPALAQLPGMLAAVLQRLLEKNAEQRYQSLHSLRRDLASCRAGLAAPALSGNHGRFTVSQTLHGREDALAALLGAFERSAQGGRETVLVAGHAGIGKSAVVHEVHKPIAARRAWFLSGKFEQYQRDLPYACLVQAFQGLVRHLLGEPEHVLQQWAARLRTLLGSGLGVLVELIPELAHVVGPTEAAPALAPDQAERRLHRLFARFAGAFAGAGHPLVLFLDDLHWADAASVRLIEAVMAAPDNGHLLFIGACRDNEIGSHHPLAGLRARLPAAGVAVATLTLAPLSEPQVARMVADTVRAPGAECAALARLCFCKTGGNPFFLNQFLGSIHDAGHLRYLAAEDRWMWDLAAIEQADYTDNVVELLLAKIARLPAAARDLLQLAASIGNRFSLETLALAAGRSAWDAQQALWPALDAGLVQPRDGGYKYLDPDGDANGVGYRFLHDRVQQAAYLAAPTDARAARHLRIGRLLLRAADGRLERQLFTVVEQLNAGRALIDDPDERLQLAALNLRAAARARQAVAFQATLEHMRTGLELLPGDAGHTEPALWLDLQLGAAEAAYLCGRFDEAEAGHARLRARPLAPLERARCSAVQAHQYQLQGRLLDAIVVLREGLAQLGIEVPHEAAAMQVRYDGIMAEVERLHGARAPEELLEAGEMRDALALAALRLMHGMWMAAYYAGQQDLSALMVASMTSLSMRQGTSDFSAVAYVAYAMLLTQRSGDVARGQRFGATALALARRRTDLHTRIQTALMFAALINHWTRPLRASDTLYEEAFGWALEIGDFVQVGLVAAVRATERIILGDYLPDLLHAIERDLALMRANGQQAMADCCIAAAVQPIKCLTGASPRSGIYDDDGFSEARFIGQYGDSRLYRAYLLQGKIRNAYLFDTEDAEALAGRLEEVTQIMRGQAKVPETSFYAALILVRALRRDPARADAGALLARFAALRASLAGWAAQGPQDLRAKHWLVEAERARQRHDLPLAVRSYQNAIDAAGQAGYVNVQALANELCGECWLEQAQPRVAEVFIGDAIARYEQWGAQGKAAQLRVRLAALLPRLDGRITRSHSASPADGNASLDLLSLLKATQALSHEVGLRNVLQRLIQIARENAGAQIARLLLWSDGAWRLEADGAGDDAGDAVSVLQARRVDLNAGADPQLPLSVLRYAIRTGAEVIEDNIPGAARFADDPYVRAQKPRAVMCLPVRHGGRIEGVLYFENRLAAASFTEERIGFLRMLGTQAMISIASARLHDSLEQRVAERTAQLEQANRKLATLSATDGLTGLANRRHFDEALRAQCARATRLVQPLALVLLDVDHFKKFNDHYGHQAGDACLVRVAEALAAGARRASDLAARYGGEEFAVVLPDTGADEARRIGEALRRAIETLGLAHAGSSAGHVTISVGIAVQPAQAGADPDALLRVADAALYRAKHAGRNRVESSGG